MTDKTELQEGDVVLCTVERIAGTVVFVKIEGDGEGTIITSEIASGRIRNLRDYVVPKKKIVCKVLKKGQKGYIYLSLRRVSQKERKEVIQEYKNEKKAESILKGTLKDKAPEIIKKIRQKEESLYDFLQGCKTTPSKIEKFMGKGECKRIIDIISKEKEKKAIIKKQITLTTEQNNGLKKIKEILNIKTEKNQLKIIYLGSGKYSLKLIGTDYKELNNQMKKIIEQIENNAKKEKIEIEIKGK